MSAPGCQPARPRGSGQVWWRVTPRGGLRHRPQSRPRRDEDGWRSPEAAGPAKVAHYRPRGTRRPRRDPHRVSDPMVRRRAGNRPKDGVSLFCEKWYQIPCSTAERKLVSDTIFSGRRMRTGNVPGTVCAGVVLAVLLLQPSEITADPAQVRGSFRVLKRRSSRTVTALVSVSGLAVDNKVASRS